MYEWLYIFGIRLWISLVVLLWCVGMWIMCELLFVCHWVMLGVIHRLSTELSTRGWIGGVCRPRREKHVSVLSKACHPPSQEGWGGSLFSLTGLSETDS